MKALLFDDGIRFCDDVPLPNLPGESLIKIRLAGICSTDLEIAKGYMGFCGIPGHEFVGEIVSDANPERVGKRVVGEINAACGRCASCCSQNNRHCPHRTVLGILKRPGCFAEYLSLPPENLHLVPDGLPDEEAVFTEPLAAAFRILEQCDISKKDQVVLLGDGKLGLLIAQVLKDRCALTLVGKHEGRQALYKAWGIAFSALSQAEAKGFAADIVIDSSGSPEGFQMAQAWVKPLGKIILKSTCAGDAALNLAPIVIHETTVIGSRCGPFEPALEALAEGRVDVRSLISERYPLEKGKTAFQTAGRSGVLKVLLFP